MLCRQAAHLVSRVLAYFADIVEALLLSQGSWKILMAK